VNGITITHRRQSPIHWRKKKGEKVPGKGAKWGLPKTTSRKPEKSRRKIHHAGPCNVTKEERAIREKRRGESISEGVMSRLRRKLGISPKESLMGSPSICAVARRGSD